MGVGELFKRLHVLHLRGGLTTLWAARFADTLQQLVALYRVWTDCALDEHKSHIAIYRPPALVPISEFRTFVQSIDGISFKTSKAIEAHFKAQKRTLGDAAVMTVAEWREIPGIGPKLATHIVDVFRRKV